MTMEKCHIFSKEINCFGTGDSSDISDLQLYSMLRWLPGLPPFLCLQAKTATLPKVMLHYWRQPICEVRLIWEHKGHTVLPQFGASLQDSLRFQVLCSIGWGLGYDYITDQLLPPPNFASFMSPQRKLPNKLSPYNSLNQDPKFVFTLLTNYK